MSDNEKVPEHSHNSEQDTLASFSNIVSKLDSVADKLEAIIGYGTRTRFLTRIMAAVIVVMFMLGAGGFYEIHQSQIEACHARNVTRANEVLLWQKVIQISDAGKKPTQEGKEIQTKFIDYVERTFPQIDCETNYSLNPFNINGG